MPASLHAAARLQAAERFRPRLWLLAAVLALGGCAMGYVNVMQRVDQELAAQNTQAALKSLEPLSGGGDQTLYLLNKAMVQRMAGDYTDSVQTFEQVKPLMLYLEATSVSETAAALTLNENLRTYEAPLYERLLVHVYQGLNFLQLGQPDGARVEAAQMDDLLKRLYPGSGMAPNGGDAFPRYFTGLVYENLGQYSDAMIAYRQAYQAYKAQGVSDQAIPQDLKLSLCRFAEYLGLTDELNTYKQSFGLEHWPPVDKQDADGQLIFVFSDGLGPLKYPQSVTLPDPSNGHYFSVSLPALQRRPPPVQAVEVSVGDVHVRTERMASIMSDANKQLEADKPKLMAAELARNVTRSAVANKADQNTPGLGSVVSLIASAVDQADVRIWGTLPDNIQVARLRLAPGTYDVTLNYLGGRGAGATHTLKNIQIQAGQMTFSAQQWISFN